LDYQFHIHIGHLVKIFQQQTAYKRGQMGLSYEMIINSNPCISYNMEDNTTCLMLLVIAHAGMGHNHFFKNNYMFKQWTNADTIVDYMKFARDYILNVKKYMVLIQ
jgi:stage V sporulation protein R